MRIHSCPKIRSKCFSPGDDLFSSATGLSFSLFLLVEYCIQLQGCNYAFTCFSVLLSILRICGDQKSTEYFQPTPPDLLFMLFHPDLCPGLCMDYICKISCPKHPGSFSQWEKVVKGLREKAEWEGGLAPQPSYTLAVSAFPSQRPEGFLVAQMVKNLPAMQETWIWSLGQEDPLENKAIQCIKKQRHHFFEKGLYSQVYGLSSSHVQMWELDHKEGRAPKNWCFSTVVLGETLEIPMDRKENKSVNPKGNQPWIFIGRTDVEPEAAVLWPPHVTSWLIGKASNAGKGGEGQEEKR